QSRKDLLVDQVARHAKKDQCVRSLLRRLFLLHPSDSPFGFSAWPPNCFRMADNTFAAYSPLPRESKRENNAALSTGVGTPSSMAAARAERPSLESESCPE